MDKLQNLDILNELLDRVNNTDPGLYKLNNLKKEVAMVIRNVVVDPTTYNNRIQELKYRKEQFTEGKVSPAGKQYQRRLINILKEAIEEVELFHPDPEERQNFIKPGSDKQEQRTMIKNDSNKIFLVHGHDDAMKQAAARCLDKIGLKPIILHEQPNAGRTIIEKFEEYSNCQYAVVLLSPDDLAYPAAGKPKEAKYRARQNVILELGFFIGRLGRDRVFPLFRQHKDFEMPSDYQGVIFCPFDEDGAWQMKLAQELKHLGYELDANKLFE